MVVLIDDDEARIAAGFPNAGEDALRVCWRTGGSACTGRSAEASFGMVPAMNANPFHARPARFGGTSGGDQARSAGDQRDGSFRSLEVCGAEASARFLPGAPRESSVAIHLLQRVLNPAGLQVEGVIAGEGQEVYAQRL